MPLYLAIVIRLMMRHDDFLMLPLVPKRMSGNLIHLIASPLGHDPVGIVIVFAPDVPLEAKDVDVLDKHRDPDEDR